MRIKGIYSPTTAVTSKEYIDMISRAEEKRYLVYRFMLTLEAMRDRGHKPSFLGYLRMMDLHSSSWYGGGAINLDDILAAAKKASESGGKP